jgi:hypothetical protein
MAESGWEVLPHPDAPEFAAVRAELARLFLDHKIELGLYSWLDEEIVAKVSDITAALISCGQVALQRGDTACLDTPASGCSRISPQCGSTGEQLGRVLINAEMSASRG